MDEEASDLSQGVVALANVAEQAGVNKLTGTRELKHMLLRDVDTIFECKLCRSLFRGLPNLITHREYYCLSSHAPDMDGEEGQSVAVKELVQALYPRPEGPDQVVRLEPIQTTDKAVFQYLTTEEELAW
ncbi:hypothetical protein CRUP_006353 [Coryphaenoides rupestris]|nr:hypothetical protein CRUP_006353 [Coryphaenoides rupestris]